MSRSTGLTKDAEGFVNGVAARDVETGEELRCAARSVVINATGAVHRRRAAHGGCHGRADDRAQPGHSPGLRPSFLPGDSAIMVPHTSDGRVMFAIPWHGHTLVGTTDTPVEAATLEPVAMEQEIDFILATAALYLAESSRRADILSVFAGIRPLVRSGGLGAPRRHCRAITPSTSIRPGC